MRAGQPSGTGFVEYESPADAAKALEGSNGAYLDDRQMWCEFSGQQTGRGNGQESGAPGESDTLFCGNVSFYTEEQTLKDFFS